MMKLTALKVDPEFQGKIPPLTFEELEQLEKNIVNDGKVINPIIVWNRLIVDGHNRYAILQKHPDIPYTVHEKEFADRFEVIIWICKNQLGRRNLSPEQKNYLLGKQYEAEKVAHGGDRKSADAKSSYHNDNLISGEKTCDRIAKENGVNRITVIRAEKFANCVDEAEKISPGSRQKILSGTVKGTAKDIMSLARTPPEERSALVEKICMPKEPKKFTNAILYMTFVGYKLMPDLPNEQFSDAAHTASESEKLSPFKRKLAVLIVLVSIAMMLLENVIGVKMYLTSCIGAAALVLTGVLTEKEALNSIHQPTIFLFAGVLALSDAIQTTGAGDVVADWMIRLLGDTTNPYIIMLVFFLVPFILTQVMSNLATLTIFIPLVTSACIRMGVDPRAAVVGVITASCVSIMTPMAAPCQIMIIEPGGYTLKDYLKCGTPLALILIVVSVFFLPTLYPFA